MSRHLLVSDRDIIGHVCPRVETLLRARSKNKKLGRLNAFASNLAANKGSGLLVLPARGKRAEDKRLSRVETE